MESSWVPDVWMSWILLIGGVVVLLLVLVRVLVGGVTRGPGDASGGESPPGRTPAQQIVDERLTRGEITLEQHQAISRALIGEPG